MDFKDKIIMCLVAMVVVLAIFLQGYINKQEQEPEPANKIIYNVVDVNGDIVGTIKADDFKKCY